MGSYLVHVAITYAVEIEADSPDEAGREYNDNSCDYELSDAIDSDIVAVVDPEAGWGADDLRSPGECGTCGKKVAPNSDGGRVQCIDCYLDGLRTKRSADAGDR